MSDASKGVTEPEMASKLGAIRFVRRSVYCLPGPGKQARGGEDAFFCTAHALGIADGVGSWEAEGVDPSLYPRKLMSAALHASTRTSRKELDSVSEFPPLAILESAYQEAAASRIMGSCTAVLGTMIDDRRLGVLNVGDSGLRILRDGKLFFGTTELQWRFNCPHQLGPTSRDTPAGGERSILTLHEGDVLVLGSDGLFDNVFDEDIVRIASPLGRQAVIGGGSQQQQQQGSSSSAAKGAIEETSSSREAVTASAVAEELAKYARSLSLHRSGVSPFAKNAAAAGHFYQGGKPDDITVVVALAQYVTPTTAVEQKDSDSNDGLFPDENEENCPLLVEELMQAKKGGAGGGGWHSHM